MFDSGLIWFLILAIVIGLGVWWMTGHTKDNLIPAGGYTIAAILLTVLCFYGSRGAATSDTELWNGQVVSKERLHGSYQRSYDCRCRTVYSGSGKDRTSRQVCDTCYEDRYTVHWNCKTTIGDYTIDSKDTTFRSVYLSPDPARWTAIYPGEPVAKTSSYTNYVQAVPESLFTPAAADLKAKFANLIPAYPDQIYDFYRVNRFLTPDAPAWNSAISELLKTRGPAKQVNTIVVVAKTNDPNYIYALRDAWEGANKNDVVLVIGSTARPKIEWVDVISWTKKELFKIQLRDEVLALGTISREQVLGVLTKQIDTNFERRRMREFQYLESMIDPPTWLMLTLFIVMLGGGLGTVYIVNNQSFTPRPTRPFRRF